MAIGLKQKVSALAVAAFACVGLTFAPVAVQAAEGDYQIYPTPHSVTYAEGEQTLRKDVTAIIEDGIDADTVRRMDEALALKGSKAAKANEIPAGKGTTVLVGIKDSDGAVDKRVDELTEQGKLTVPEDLFTKTDAYLLASVPAEGKGPDQVIVLGKDTDSAYYGLTTLYQILQQAPGAKLRAFTVADYADVITRGFIEGYYGNPWSTEDRVALMEWGGYYKLNAYFYAPKDDPKHNAKWREKYSEEEVETKIKPLAKAGNESKTRFIFALHPFMYNPITSANYDETFPIMKEKFLQVIDAGVRQIAILADDAGNQGSDLYTKLCEDTTAWLRELQKMKNEDGSLKYPGLKDTLIFCPVNYMGFGEAWYKNLPDNVQVINTGGRVWGKIDSAFASTFQNNSGGVAPFMWINWPCSDNDKDALHMGGHNSFLGSDLKPGQVEGVVLNPMQQSEPSKQAIFMNADFTWNLWSSTEHADQAWEDSFSYIDHNSPNATKGSEALRELSVHMRRMYGGGVAWESGESADIKDEINTFRANLAADSVTVEDVESMTRIFAEIQQTAKDFRANAGTPRMFKQMEPWMDTWDDLTRAALGYLEALKADLAGDDSALLENYSAAQTAFDSANGHGFHYIDHTEYARVGKAHITPMVNALAEDVAERATLAADPDANIQKFITSRTDAPTGSIENVMDGDPATGVSYKNPESIAKDTYIGFEQTQPFDLDRFTITYDAGHLNDTIRTAKVQVLKKDDPKAVGTWEDLEGKTISNNRTRVVDFTELGQKGVYGVRLIATAANEGACWLTVNEIEINKIGTGEPEEPEVITGTVSLENQVVAPGGGKLQDISDGNANTETMLRKNDTNESDRDTTVAGATIVVTFPEAKAIDSIVFDQGRTNSGDVIKSGEVFYQDTAGKWVKAGDVTNGTHQVFDLGKSVRAQAIKVVNMTDVAVWWRVDDLHAVSGDAGEQPMGDPAASTNLNTYQSNPIANIIDGDDSTKFWSSTGTSVGSYVMYEFGGSKTIDAVRILQGGTDCFAAADILATSDADPNAASGSWVKVASIAGGGDQTAEFERREATAVMVKATQESGNWLQVFEVEAFEKYAYSAENIYASEGVDASGLTARVANGIARAVGEAVVLPEEGDVVAVDLGAVRRGIQVTEGSAGVAGAKLVVSQNALEWREPEAGASARYVGYQAEGANTSVDLDGLSISYLNSLTPAVVKSDLSGEQTLDAAKVFDGSVTPATKSSGGPTAGDTVVFDLGQERTITSLEYFVPETSLDPIRNAVIEVANDPNAADDQWTQVLDINSENIIADGEGFDLTAKECEWLTHSSTFPGNMVAGPDENVNATGRYLRIRFTGTYTQRWVEIGELRINNGEYVSTYAGGDFESTVAEQSSMSPANMLDKDMNTAWAPLEGEAGTLTYHVSSPIRPDGNAVEGVRIISRGNPSQATVKAVLYTDDSYSATQEVTLGTIGQASQEFRFGTPVKTTRAAAEFTAVKDIKVEWPAGTTPQISEIYLLAKAPAAPEANVDALGEALANAKAVDTSTWTDNSKAALDEAIALAEAALASPETLTSTGIASLTAQLDKALNDGVVKYTATELAELVDQAIEDGAAYTEASWNAYRDALAAAQEALKDAGNLSEETGATLADALKKAQEALVFNTATAERAAQMVEDCEDIYAGGSYTVASKKSYDNAIAALSDLVDAGETDPAVLQSAMDALEAACKGLVDVSALMAERAEFEKHDPAAYTADSFAPYRQAYEDSAALIESGTPEQVADAVAMLQSAKAGLVVLDLDALIAECEKLSQDDYTVDSWDALARALEAAKAGKESADAQKLAQELSDAKAALVNVVALKDAIARAEGIDASRYTAESVAKLEVAVDSAAAELKNGSVQSVEAARQAILSALDGLVATGGSQGGAGNTGGSGGQGDAGKPGGSLPVTGDAAMVITAAVAASGLAATAAAEALRRRSSKN